MITFAFVVDIFLKLCISIAYTVALYRGLYLQSHTLDLTEITMVVLHLVSVSCVVILGLKQNKCKMH